MENHVIQSHSSIIQESPKGRNQKRCVKSEPLLNEDQSSDRGGQKTKHAAIVSLASVQESRVRVSGGRALVSAGAAWHLPVGAKR